MRGALRALVTAAVAVSLIGFSAAAGADPVHQVSVNMWGTGPDYTASMVGSLTSWTGTAGAVLPIASSNVAWGATTGPTQISGTCVLSLAVRVDRDPTTGQVDFECFAVGHAIEVGEAPTGEPVVYQAYLFGNVHVTVTPGVGATVTGLANPFPIGFPNRPGGWSQAWAQQSITCSTGQPCELTVTV